jgi:hypothetical protein
VQEWEGYAEPPESVREVHLPTLHGAVPRLPGQVTLVYADGSTALPRGLARAHRGPGGPGRHQRPEEHLTTRAGTVPALADTVFATYNDGSKDSRAPVTRDPVEPDRYARPGTFEVKGTVTGTTYRATATVTVTAAPS